MPLSIRTHGAVLAIAASALVACADEAERNNSAPAAAASETAATAPAVAAVTPDAVRWTPNPRLAGVDSASIVGDSARSGLYVSLGRMRQGATFPPHSHPDRRITTVVSGTMYYGTGPAFDHGRLRRYPAGSVVETPPGVPHFMAAKDGTAVMQETGMGPSGLDFVPRP